LNIQTPPLQEVPEETPGSSRRRELLETIKTITLAVMFYALINLTTVRVVVEGPSMRPTLISGEWIVVNRLAYRLSRPRRGDVIVFLPPTNAQTDDLIKRVIGLPRETVEIRDGSILINEEELSEAYAKGRTFPDGKWVLGEDQLFVMGDNRELSLDSRSFGSIPLEDVVGNSLVIIWPPEEWGPLDWRSNGVTPVATGLGGEGSS
jgi:signal peptidase I